MREINVVSKNGIELEIPFTRKAIESLKVFCDAMKIKILSFKYNNGFTEWSIICSRKLRKLNGLKLRSHIVKNHREFLRYIRNANEFSRALSTEIDKFIDYPQPHVTYESLMKFSLDEWVKVCYNDCYESSYPIDYNIAFINPDDLLKYGIIAVYRNLNVYKILVHPSAASRWLIAFREHGSSSYSAHEYVGKVDTIIKDGNNIEMFEIDHYPSYSYKSCIYTPGTFLEEDENSINYDINLNDIASTLTKIASGTLIVSVWNDYVEHFVKK